MKLFAKRIIPIAYWMDPVAALAAIVTMVACEIFSGDLPTVLLRIPGTPASAAYADEAYAFSKRGEVGWRRSRIIRSMFAVC